MNQFRKSWRSLRQWLNCSAAFILSSWFCTGVSGEPSFYHSLAEPCRVAVSNMPLNDAVARLRQVHRINIWLDRRIDPTHPIDLAASGMTLEQSLQQIALQCGAEVGFADGVVIVGPIDEATDVATRILAMHQQFKVGAHASKHAALKDFDLTWPILATPNEILSTIETHSGLSFESAALPHDLWAQGELRQVDPLTTLVLIGAGFGRVPQFEPNSVQVSFVEQRDGPVQATLLYPSSKLTATVLDRLRSIQPNVKIQTKESQVAVSASAKVHHAIAMGGQPGAAGGVGAPKPANLKAGKPKPDRPNPSMTQIESLRLVNRAGDALQGICQASGLKLDARQASQAKLQTVVRLEVKDTTIGEILKAICQQADLSLKIDDTTATVTD